MFAKVFSQILDSSLADDYQVRLVFEDLLKLSDAKGIVDMTVASIARRTNVPLEIVQRGIGELEKPDTTSRTPDRDGRRITRLDAHRDWGWQIVNFIKYRESASKEMLRMAEKDRKAAYRSKYPQKGSPSTPPTPKETESTEAEAEADMSRVRPGLSRTKVEKANKFITPTIDDCIAFVKTLNLPASDGEYIYNNWEANGWTRNGRKIKDWKAAIRAWNSGKFFPSQKKQQPMLSFSKRPRASGIEDLNADGSPRV